MSRYKDEIIEIALRFSNMLENAGIPIWLEYGSALGAVRDGGMIDGDYDIDFGVWEKDFNKMIELIKGKTDKWTAEGFPRISWHQLVHDGAWKLLIKPTSLSEAPKFDPWRNVHIDVFPIKEYDGIRATWERWGNTKFKPKLYYHKNLKTIKFEGFDFHVSKYVEKYLDYRYQDSAGEGTSWKTRLALDEMQNADYWLHKLPCYSREEEITACVIGVFDLFHIGHLRLLKRSSKIFNKVVAAVHPDNVVLQYKGKLPVIPYEHRLEIVKSCKYVDDVIMAPLPENTEGCYETMVDFLIENNLDYMVHAHEKQEFLEGQFSSLIKESRLFLLPETPDYHTTD